MAFWPTDDPFDFFVLVAYCWLYFISYASTIWKFVIG